MNRRSYLIIYLLPCVNLSISKILTSNIYSWLEAWSVARLRRLRRLSSALSSCLTRWPPPSRTPSTSTALSFFCWWPPSPTTPSVSLLTSWSTRTNVRGSEIFSTSLELSTTSPGLSIILWYSKFSLKMLKICKLFSIFKKYFVAFRHSIRV